MQTGEMQKFENIVDKTNRIREGFKRTVRITTQSKSIKGSVAAKSNIQRR